MCFTHIHRPQPNQPLQPVKQFHFSLSPAATTSLQIDQAEYIFWSCAGSSINLCKSISTGDKALSASTKYYWITSQLIHSRIHLQLLPLASQSSSSWTFPSSSKHLHNFCIGIMFLALYYFAQIFFWSSQILIHNRDIKYPVHHLT